MLQRDRALARANRIRIDRAALKRDVKAGRESAGELLRGAPDLIGKLRIAEILTWEDRVGRIRADRLLHRAGVSVTLTVRDAGQATRERAAAAIDRARS